MSDDLLVLTNVHKTYLLGLEGVPALRGIDLRVAKGEFIVILGTSGGGKSSLLNLIGTIDRPTKGDISMFGQRISQNATDQQMANLRLRHIGFVFQAFNLIPTMSAVENVSLPMILRGGMASDSIKKRATDLLKRVGLSNRLGHTPSMMSGGEQQRVTIARAIANHPQLLLLDEPTGDLDTLNSAIILSLLLTLNRDEGITMIMVTHDQSLALHAHRVVHLSDGKIVRIETIKPHLREQADQRLWDKCRQIAARPDMDLNVFDHLPSASNTSSTTSTAVTVSSNNHQSSNHHFDQTNGVTNASMQSSSSLGSSKEPELDEEDDENADPSLSVRVPSVKLTVMDESSSLPLLAAPSANDSSIINGSNKLPEATTEKRVPSKAYPPFLKPVQ